MVYYFKQALHIAGRDFPRGNHEVPEKCENHAHFLKYVGCGLIEEAKAPPVVVESAKVRGEKLLNKLIKKADARKEKEAAKQELKESEEPAKVPEVPKEPESPKEPEVPVESEAPATAEAETVVDEKPKGKSKDKEKRSR